MVKKIGRLFVIKSRLDAMLVIYALALGAVSRGRDYLDQYPGMGGWMLFCACLVAVFMAGAKIMEATRPEARLKRRHTDRVSAAEGGPAASP